MDRKNSAVRLFISDLPETTDAMIPGGVYAMIAETPPARFPVLAASMAGAVHAGTTATLLLPSSPKQFVDRLSQVGFPEADDAIETGRLQVFQLQEDFSKKMFRFGAEAFTSELDHFRLPANSYLLIDQADELLSLHDISLAVEQAEALGRWARKLKVTVLLVFTRVAAVSASLATLTGLMDYLSGIVRLGGHQDGLDLTFEYWQSQDGTVAAKVYHLVILDNGRYQVKKAEPLALEAPTGLAATEPLEPEETPENLRYLYIDPVLGGLSKQMAGQWHACDSVVSLIRAAFGARAPAVLLSFERHTALRDLAEAVHTLRLSLGRRARIVVVERDASLRYQNEILLLRLGTSLVVHRDVQENRIPLMLESLRGQVFNREIEMDFDAALASVVTSVKRGYLPPVSFAREADSIVDRADLLNLPCAMVVATLNNAQDCMDLLTQVKATRAGDLTSTDGQHCFIFFSGCPESSLTRALQAVLGEAFERWFGSMQAIVSRPDIRQRLRILAQEVQGKTFPDTLLPALTESHTQEPPPPVREVAAPAISPVAVSAPPLAAAAVVPAAAAAPTAAEPATVAAAIDLLEPSPPPQAVSPEAEEMPAVEDVHTAAVEQTVAPKQEAVVIDDTPPVQAPVSPAPAGPKASKPAKPLPSAVAPSPVAAAAPAPPVPPVPHVFGLLPPNAAPAPARTLRRATRRSSPAATEQTTQGSGSES